LYERTRPAGRCLGAEFLVTISCAVTGYPRAHGGIRRPRLISRDAEKTKRLHTLFRRLLIVFVIVNSVAMVLAVNSSSTSWSNRLVALAVIAGVGAGLMFIGLMLTKTRPA
jgi:hypothetical protein